MVHTIPEIVFIHQNFNFWFYCFHCDSHEYINWELKNEDVISSCSRESLILGTPLPFFDDIFLGQVSSVLVTSAWWSEGNPRLPWASALQTRAFHSKSGRLCVWIEEAHGGQGFPPTANWLRIISLVNLKGIAHLFQHTYTYNYSIFVIMKTRISQRSQMLSSPGLLKNFNEKQEHFWVVRWD